jgi:hypothetical protein
MQQYQVDIDELEPAPEMKLLTRRSSKKKIDRLRNADINRDFQV